MNNDRSISRLAPGLLPVLLALFPVVFYYANNAEILNPASLWRMSGLMALIGAAVYLAYLLLSRRPYPAALAAFIFLIFFHTYGAAYDRLLALDVVRMTHFSRLPAYALLGVYASLLGLRPGDRFARDTWRILNVALVFLIALNLVRIAPVEIRRAQTHHPQAAAGSPGEPGQAISSRPDIYYLVLDEAAGFEAMRQYWKNDRAGEFAAWLARQGFYVAEDSHGQTINTVSEIARRLNFEDYAPGSETLGSYFRLVADNRTMRYLKARGYITIVFDEARSSVGYEAKPKILADINFEDDPSISRKDDGSLLDAFGMMVAEKSMLRVYTRYAALNRGRELRHQTFIYFTTNKLGELEDISPKFVYAHLILPHFPFMFTEDGSYVDPAYHLNWDYYEGTYNFALQIARQMIENILEDADPRNPPVIILQSDHGARNTEAETRMNNYPEAYKTLIVNALHIPNCPEAPLTPDLNPIDTFPIVFNCVFDAGMPLQPAPASTAGSED